MMNLATLSTLVLYLASGATATNIEKDTSSNESSSNSRSLRGAPNSPYLHTSKAELLKAINNLKDAPNKIAFPGPGSNPPTSGHSLFDCFTTCETESNVPDCIQQRCFDAEVANDSDASLQEETSVKSAAPGSGGSLLNCFLSCEAEHNVGDCISRRCFGSETKHLAFVDRPTSPVQSICEACDSFQTESSRQFCLNFYGCDEKDNDSHISLHETEPTDVCGFCELIQSEFCLDFYNCDTEEKDVSFVKTEATATDCEICDYFFTERARNACYRFNDCDNDSDSKLQENRKTNDAEFASTASSCSNRGSTCSTSSDCCSRFCAFAFFPPRCL